MMLCETGKINDVEKYHLKWFGNRKLDGVRCFAYCDEQIKLIGRSGSDYTSKFPEIVEGLKGFKGILDGEIACIDFDKTASRVHTENKLKSKILINKYPAVFHIFDILNLNGEDFKQKSLIERVKTLNGLIFQTNSIELVKYTTDLINLWETAKQENWEGIVIKNPISTYSDKRSWNWIKIKKEITKDITAISYEINPAGIRIESSEGLACQISGLNSNLVKNEIDKTGSCLIEVKGMEETANGKIRMIVFKSIKNGE
ncbi:MAG: RNA ligase family protein [Candidatus Nanoarchaeia archaeon]|nr:RNA ligase family protein [Candidatus Nanoarchaeia archaeon]